MPLFDFFQSNSSVFIALAALLGASIGSFLNVVIYRLPLMMERQWQQQCAELLADGATTAESEEERFNLAKPDSTCPHCGHAIRAWENIPLISYLFILRGRCSACKRAISPRYPIVEGATALLSAAVAWHFGVTWETLAALCLTWSLITLTLIDCDHQLLPDSITLPMLWLGLAASLFGLFTDMQSSIIGAMVGYLSLWSIYWAFKLLTGKEGMGYGDFKLLALLGAWLGWQTLPVIILISSAVGAIIGIASIIVLGRDRNTPIPFGPYLAIAGWITLIWGEEIIQTYFHFIGLS